MSLIDPMEKVKRDMEIAYRQREFCNQLAKNDEKFSNFWQTHRSRSNYDLVLSDYSKTYPAKTTGRTRRATIIYDDEDTYPDTVVFDGPKKVYGGLPGKKVNAVQIANKTIMLPSDEEIQKAYSMNQSTNPDKSYTSYDREKTQIINKMVPLVKELDDLSQQYESLQKRNEYGQNVLDWDHVKSAFPPSAPRYDDLKSTDVAYSSKTGGFGLHKMGTSSMPSTDIRPLKPDHSPRQPTKSLADRIMMESLNF
jgi:hypothetical protein